MRTTAVKSQRIDVRASPAAKATLKRAAAIANKNISQFLLDAGLTAAGETLADRRVFALDPERWQAFLSVLDRPVKPKKRLAKLLSTRGVLD